MVFSFRRLVSGSESEEESCDEWVGESCGAEGDGCVRNSGVGGCDAWLSRGFRVEGRDDRIPDRDAVMCPRAVAGVWGLLALSIVSVKSG